MKRISRLFAILLAFALCLCPLLSCSPEEKAPSGSKTLSDGKLTVGYTIYAPMNYYDDSNNFVGFDTELACAFADSLGVEIEFVEIDWDNKLIDLASKNIDVIWNGMTITDALQAAAAVSSPYLENRQVVVCRAADAEKFTTVADVSLATSIAVEKGSAGETVAQTAGVTLNTFTAQRDTLMEVKTGASDIAIIDLTMAKTLTGAGTDYSDLVYIDVGYENEQFGVAFRQGDEFLAAVFDLFIETCKADGTYNTLCDRYFK